MAWGLTTFALGVLFGWANPGTEDRIQLLKAGTLLAILLAFGYAMLGAALQSDPLLLGPGYVAGLFTFALLVVLFLAGTWVGDWLERRARPSKRPGSSENGAGRDSG